MLIPNPPVVSIIIPTYNQCALLEKALQSVLAQTYTNFEVIIINNYSEDKTIEVVESFDDPRISLIHFKNHGSIAAARNLGINKSKGKYIALLDSDDLWLPNKIDVCLEHLEEGYDLVCHAQIFMDERVGTQKVVTYGPSSTTQYHNLLFGNNTISTSTVLMTKEIFEKAGQFNEAADLITAEDYDLWLNISKMNAKILVLDDVLGKKRLHFNNTCYAVGNHVNAILYVVRMHFESLQTKRPIHSIRYFYKKAMIYYGMGRSYYMLKNYRGSFKYCLKAIIYFPFFLRSYVAIIMALWAIMFKKNQAPRPHLSLL